MALQFQDGSKGQYGRDVNAFPPGTQDPKLFVEYYDQTLKGALAFEAEDYIYERYLETRTIPSMSDTTITIQKMDAITGAGLTFDPMTGDYAGLINPDTNGAILDMSNTDARNPLVLNRMAFKGEVQLWGLWIQVNDIQNITGMYSILEESVKALARAIAETKDAYTRNFIMINSTKVWAGGKSQTTITPTDTLTFQEIVTQCYRLQRNTVERRATDKKDVDWDAYKDGSASALIRHPAPIKGFKGDGGRYKVFISVEGYDQLINQTVFKEYFISGKSLAANVNPSLTNSSGLKSHGEADAFFNFRLIKTPNTWRGMAGVGNTVHYDTAVILPEGTFANLSIAGHDGVSFYMFKSFEGSVVDPLARNATVGGKWIGGTVKMTPYTAAVTIAYATTDYSI